MSQKSVEARNGMPEFYALLEEAAETHHRKSHDYASNDNPSGNYHFAGKVALLFAHSEQDAGFVGRIAEKIYRLANLEGSKKSALNETVADTETDILTITALWMADRRRRRNNQSQALHSAINMGDISPEQLGIISSVEKVIDSCNVHDRYEVGCKDCRSINGLV